jgi:hypothetical protein
MIHALSYLVWLATAPAAPPPSAPAAPLKVWWSPDLKLSSLTEIDAALDQALPEPIDVVPAGQPARKVKTCNDLLAATRSKFDLPSDHQSESDWNGLLSVSIRCYALEALKTAKPPSSSYLGWFQFSQAGVAKLPPGLEMPSGQGDDKAIAKAEKKCKPWGQYDRHLKLKVDGTDDGQVRGDGWAGRLTLYGRGDLDGDGLEDLMFYRYAKVEEGSESDESLFIVSQTAAKGCARIVKTLPTWPASAHP